MAAIYCMVFFSSLLRTACLLIAYSKSSFAYDEPNKAIFAGVHESGPDDSVLTLAVLTGESPQPSRVLRMTKVLVVTSGQPWVGGSRYIRSFNTFIRWLVNQPCNADWGFQVFSWLL